MVLNFFALFAANGKDMPHGKQKMQNHCPKIRFDLCQRLKKHKNLQHVNERKAGSCPFYLLKSNKNLH